MTDSDSPNFPPAIHTDGEPIRDNQDWVSISASQVRQGARLLINGIPSQIYPDGEGTNRYGARIPKRARRGPRIVLQLQNSDGQISEESTHPVVRTSGVNWPCLGFVIIVATALGIVLWPYVPPILSLLGFP